jgi:hypothetical protein
MHIGYLWKSQKEKDHYEDQDAGGSIILKWMTKYGLYCSGSGYGPVEGSCVHGNKLLGPIKCWEVLKPHD